MSIEQAIAENTAAIIALTAALGLNAAQGSKQVAAEEKPAAEEKTTKPAAAKSAKAAAPKAPKITTEMAQAALLKIKDTHGLEYARAVLSDFGYAKMNEITAEKAAEVLAAAEAKFEALNNGDDEAEDDSDGI
jgi:hypothetical protein